MTFTISTVDGVVNISIQGELDCVTVSDLRVEIDKLVTFHPNKVDIELSSLRMVDSSGIGALVSIYKRVRSYGGAVVIRGLRDQPLAAFQLLRLDRVMLGADIYEKSAHRFTTKRVLQARSLATLERSSDEVAEIVRHARDRDEPCTLLLGAGASVSAGIPAADGVIQKIEGDYPRAFQRAKRKTYQTLMSELDRASRHALIHDLVTKAKLNWSHLCIAWLLKDGYIGRIYTTNFDDLLIRACGLVGVSPAVYDVSVSKVSETLVREPAIFYLHGRHDGMVQVHTRRDHQTSVRRLRKVIGEASFRRPWLVVGYGGTNDPLFEHIASFKEFTAGLYWTTFAAADPASHVAKSVVSRAKQGFFCRTLSSDRFLDDLTRTLSARPPTLFSWATRDPSGLAAVPVRIDIASDASLDAAYEQPDDRVEAELYYELARLSVKRRKLEQAKDCLAKLSSLSPDLMDRAKNDPALSEAIAAAARGGQRTSPPEVDAAAMRLREKDLVDSGA